jgi:hypothetical protein
MPSWSSGNYNNETETVSSLNVNVPKDFWGPFMRTTIISQKKRLYMRKYLKLRYSSDA